VSATFSERANFDRPVVYLEERAPVRRATRRHNRGVSAVPAVTESLRLAEAALRDGALADAIAAAGAALDAAAADDDAAERRRAHRVAWQAHKALGEFEAALRHCEAAFGADADAAAPHAAPVAAPGTPPVAALPPALIALHTQSRQRRKPLALAALEVIDAAALRTRHGHGIADAVEREVAQLLRLRLRSRDLALPWTQRRWLVALADTPPAAAAAICERLRAAVQQHDWAFVAPGLQVAIALGLVTDAADSEPATALQRVDAALRRAAR
jgi:GGDEF domain-containing protein